MMEMVRVACYGLRADAGEFVFSLPVTCDAHPAR